MYLRNEPGTLLEYPFNPRSLRKSGAILPREMSDEFLAARHVFPVTPVAPPEASVIYTVTEGVPEEVSPGVWQQTWVSTPLPLTEAKDLLRLQVNSIRDQREISTAPTPFGLADADEKSSKRLLAMQAAAQTSAITGAPWDPLKWTMADDSEVLLDTVEKALMLATAVTQFGAALHTHARTLKAAIKSAKTIEQLEAIDIETGWP